MVAQTTDDILRELDRTHGGPVQFEDPRTRDRYVVIRQDLYTQVQPLIDPAPPQHNGPVEWNERKNTRRCELIDKEIAGTIQLEEAIELNRLQQELSAYLQRVAPLPLDDLRKLHAELVAKAARAEGNR
jgi:hypothetical protein